MYVCECPVENARLWVPGDRALGRVSFSLFFSFCFCWFVWWLLVISGSGLWRGAPMERKLLAAVMTKPSRSGTRNLEIASRRWPGTRASKFFPVFSCFFLSVSVDSSPDFSQFQGHVSGVEPWWKANCQRQLWHNHQDLGFAIWRLPVDADRPLLRVHFFHDYAWEK